jgi:hypothetical protein
MHRKEISIRNTKRALVLIAAVFAVSTIFVIQARAQPTHEHAAHILPLEHVPSSCDIRDALIRMHVGITHASASLPLQCDISSDIAPPHDRSGELLRDSASHDRLRKIVVRHCHND